MQQISPTGAGLSPRLLADQGAGRVQALPSAAAVVPAKPSLTPGVHSATQGSGPIASPAVGRGPALADDEAIDDGDDDDDEDDDDNASERSGVTATPSEATSAGPTGELKAAALAERAGSAKATARQLALVDAVSAVLYPQLSAQAGYSVHTASIANAIRAFLLSELGSIATQDWAVAEYSMGGVAADEGAAAGWGEASGGAASDEELDGGLETAATTTTTTTTTTQVPVMPRPLPTQTRTPARRRTNARTLRRPQARPCRAMLSAKTSPGRPQARPLRRPGTGVHWRRQCNRAGRMLPRRLLPV